MEPVSELRRREVRTYFDVIARGGSDRLLDARSIHNLGEWTGADCRELLSRLAAADATSSFSFLGRDAERYADVIREIVDAGHEIVLHGHRHIACADISSDLAHENLSRGLAAIEQVAGVTPNGFVAPGLAVNAATLAVVADLGLEWVLGTTDAPVPDELSFGEIARPYDLVLLNHGADPGEAFERIRSQSTPGTALLFHPNMLEYYDGFEAYADWIDEIRPVSIGEMFAEGGVGALNDAMRPMRVI